MGKGYFLNRENREGFFGNILGVKVFNIILENVWVSLEIRQGPNPKCFI